MVASFSVVSSGLTVGGERAPVHVLLPLEDPSAGPSIP
jgi:hypothetical protein